MTEAGVIALKSLLGLWIMTCVSCAFPKISFGYRTDGESKIQLIDCSYSDGGVKLMQMIQRVLIADALFNITLNTDDPKCMLKVTLDTDGEVVDVLPTPLGIRLTRLSESDTFYNYVCNVINEAGQTSKASINYRANAPSLPAGLETCPTVASTDTGICETWRKNECCTARLDKVTKKCPATSSAQTEKPTTGKTMASTAENGGATETTHNIGASSTSTNPATVQPTGSQTDQTGTRPRFTTTTEKPSDPTIRVLAILGSLSLLVVIVVLWKTCPGLNCCARNREDAPAARGKASQSRRPSDRSTVPKSILSKSTRRSPSKTTELSQSSGSSESSGSAESSASPQSSELPKSIMKPPPRSVVAKPKRKRRKFSRY